MPRSWNWMLILTGAALVLIEVLLGGFAGFDLVLIGSAFVIGGAIGLYFADLYVGLLSAGVLCAAYILAGRRYVRRRLEVKEGLRSNADALLGQKGIVVARMAPHQAGRVKIKDEEWRAVPAPGTTAPIEAGTEITVDGVDGVTLQVR